MRRLFTFIIILAICCGLVYAGHRYLLQDQGWYASNILLERGYLVNLALGITIVVVLYALRKKFTGSLGFLYMAGSMIKFLFFFLLFNSTYRLDGDLSRVEFFAFFIPYVLVLIGETAFLVRVFNELDDIPSSDGK